MITLIFLTSLVSILAVALSVLPEALGPRRKSPERHVYLTPCQTTCDQSARLYSEGKKTLAEHEKTVERALRHDAFEPPLLPPGRVWDVNMDPRPENPLWHEFGIYGEVHSSAFQSSAYSHGSMNFDKLGRFAPVDYLRDHEFEKAEVLSPDAVAAKALALRTQILGAAAAQKYALAVSLSTIQADITGLKADRMLQYDMEINEARQTFHG